MYLTDLMAKPLMNPAGSMVPDTSLMGAVKKMGRLIRCNIHIDYALIIFIPVVTL